MTDTERINKLEKYICSGNINGIAITPYITKSYNGISINDIGDEDGSYFGEELSDGETLRDVIDNLEVTNENK